MNRDRNDRKVLVGITLGSDPNRPGLFLFADVPRVTIFEPSL